MVLFILILCSLTLVFLILLGMNTMMDGQIIKDLKNDEDTIPVYFLLSITLFIIVFITCAATYNTFIDKSNPNYYKNQKI